MKIAQGLLQDDFLLSGETQAFLGWDAAARSQGIDVQPFGPNGLHLRARAYTRVRRGEYPLQKLFELPAFVRWARRAGQQADLIHIFLPTTPLAWIAAWIKRRTGKPVVVTFLGEKPQLSLRELWRSPQGSRFFLTVRWLAGLFFPAGPFPCDGYLVANPEIARDLRLSGCPETRILESTHRLSPESPADAFSTALAETLVHKPAFLYMGHFLPGKGVDTLLEGFARMGAPAIRLVLAWSGLGDRSRVENQVQRLQIADRVQIIDQPIHGPTLFKRSLALILPWRYSYGQVSPPLLVLEAFRTGVPLIISAGKGVGRWISNAVTALTIQPEDAQGLVNRMRWILDNPSEADRMRDQQRQVYARNMADTDIRSIYNGILQRHG